MRIGQPYGQRYNEPPSSVEPKIRYFIACEGEKTENAYFRGLMDCREEIGIQPFIEVIPIHHDKAAGNNPYTIYRKNIDEIKELPNFFETDFLCIIADRDKKSFSDSQYDKLVEAEENNEIKFIVSNPCFEFWLLLHYCDASEYDPNIIFENEKVGNRTQTELYLKEKLGGSYNKSRIQFNKNFRDKVKTAIINSKKYATESKQLKNKIGTKVGILIEEMIEPRLF